MGILASRERLAKGDTAGERKREQGKEQTDERQRQARRRSVVGGGWRAEGRVRL